MQTNKKGASDGALFVWLEQRGSFASIKALFLVAEALGQRTLMSHADGHIFLLLTIRAKREETKYNLR